MSDTLSASQFLYVAAGNELGRRSFGRCWLCGGPAYAPVKVEKWVKPTFTNYDAARGDWNAGVCEACVWCTRFKSTELADVLGREKPQNMTTYSHFVVGGKWYALSKGQKAEIKRLLLSDKGLPELAAIANSGQKHIIHLAQLNAPGGHAGYVQLEQETLHIRQSDLVWLLESVETLYRSGFNKTSIQSGVYTFYPDSDLALWRDIEPQLAAWRGSGVFDLACWLAQKE